MKCGIFLVNTGTPVMDTATSLDDYVSTVLGNDTYLDNLDFLQRQMFKRITLPQKSREWRKYFYGSENVVPSYLATANLLRDRISEKLSEATRRKCVVEVGMRCGESSLEDAARCFRDEQCDVIVIAPLYPFHFEPMLAPAFQEARAALQCVGNGSWSPRIIEIESLCKVPGFVRMIATQVKEGWSPRNVSRLLILMPSEPRALMKENDVYTDQIEWFRTQLARQVKIAPEMAQVAFVSEFDNSKWLGPFAEKTLVGWAGGAVRDVKALCPAFCSADPLGNYDAGTKLRDFFIANVTGKAPTYDVVNPYADIDQLAQILCDAALKKL